jgi:hypothetical protein
VRGLASAEDQSFNLVSRSESDSESNVKLDINDTALGGKLHDDTQQSLCPEMYGPQGHKS